MIAHSHITYSLHMALEAHEAWKQQMVEAVANKNADLSLTELRNAEVSAFGQFLMSLPADVTQSDHMKEVRRLHADLHDRAVDVALMVKQGKHDQARQTLSTGAFPQTSAALNQALVRWQVRDLAA